jgi:hypothetical protein
MAARMVWASSGRRVGGMVEWACRGWMRGCPARTRGRGRCSEWMPIRTRGSGIGNQRGQAGQGRHSGEGRCIKTRPPGRRRQAGEGRTSGAGAGAGMDAGAAASSELGGLWAVGGGRRAVGCGLAVGWLWPQAEEAAVCRRLLGRPALVPGRGPWSRAPIGCRGRAGATATATATSPNLP